jgi:hypothetical protein
MDESLLRALKRERLHVEARALDASPAAVRRHFDHVWAPADLLLARLADWPAGLARFWLAAPAGHIVFSAAPTVYLPEGLPWQDGYLPAVARLSLRDVLADMHHVLETVAHLLDHLCGCLGDPQGPWLADGAGADAGLQALGAQVAALARLGYGPAEPRAYLAWAWTGYWCDRQALNAADPLVERLLRTTLADDSWWETRRP